MVHSGTVQGLLKRAAPAWFPFCCTSAAARRTPAGTTSAAPGATTQGSPRAAAAPQLQAPSVGAAAAAAGRSRGRSSRGASVRRARGWRAVCDDEVIPQEISPLNHRAHLRTSSVRPTGSRYRMTATAPHPESVTQLAAGMASSERTTGAPVQGVCCSPRPVPPPVVTYFSDSNLRCGKRRPLPRELRL
eukprot:CAMPEP_0179030512 /NCGR_PEP_ID=MMETSP0796-20121207/10602_1 /TAXON_ID=73915 /ORGANISM="Pyrodinium bahamense, Strain pbaha01" /LENGTH=188 /DNA_ID=CAMNT_0020726693 /DNA_START=56 /DNA_END=622 /DNA_ORIENTATION=+